MYYVHTLSFSQKPNGLLGFVWAGTRGGNLAPGLAESCTSGGWWSDVRSARVFNAKESSMFLSKFEGVRSLFDVKNQSQDSQVACQTPDSNRSPINQL